MTTRIVLAYSGGAASARALSWLVRSSGAEVVTLTADVGQGDDLAEVRARALAGGAARAHVLDARDEFARNFVLPSLKAQALWDGRYPMVAAIARPLLARKLVEVSPAGLRPPRARREGARRRTGPRLPSRAHGAPRPGVPARLAVQAPAGPSPRPAPTVLRAQAQGRMAKALARKRTPPLARRWGHLMNMDLESFATAFGRFGEAA